MLLKKLRSRDERGATILFTAVFAGVALLVSGLAVDLGVQRVSRRDMQAIADLVALDLSRELDGGKPAAYMGKSSFTTAMVNSVRRNTDESGIAPVCKQSPGNTVEWVCTTSQTGSVGAPPTLTVDLGALNVDGDFFVMPVTSNDAVSAVRVNSSSKVSFRFVPGQGPVGRNAVAVQASNACWGVGSYAAALDTDKSALLYPLLGKALGTSLNLQAIGYSGLANVTVTLLDLIEVEQLDVGTVDGLLATKLSVADFYLAVADALRSNGDTLNAALLENISTHIGAVLTQVTIGQLLNITQGNDAALATDLNVFNLVTGAAFLANGSSALALNGLGLNIPLLGTLSGGLSVIQPPVHNCTKAGGKQESKQVTVGPITANLNALPAITIAGLTNVSVTTPNAVSLSATVASGTGELKTITCSPDSLSVEVKSDLAQAHLTVPVTVTAKITLGLPLGVLGAIIPSVVDLVLPVTVSVNTVPGTNTRTVTFSMPPNEQKSSSGSGQVGLSGATATIALGSGWTAKVLGLNVGALPLVQTTVTGLLPAILSSLTTAVVTPLANTIDNSLLKPLQRLLGLTVAGVDVWSHGPKPECQAPELKG